jgi:hypothetical protein
MKLHLFSNIRFSRVMATVFAVAAVTVAALPASSFAQITNSDAVSGLRAALDQGAAKAVANLSVPDGFLNNPKVRIPLPKILKQAKSAAKLLGMDKQFDELEVSMNRAAEAAVPKAKPLLINAIKQMSVQDAMGLLKGGNDSATQYFKEKTQTKLVAEFLPFATQATDKVGLAKKYSALASKGAALGLVKEDQKSLDSYVAQKAVDGLFTLIAEEEKAIRANPIGAGTDLLRRVFGAFKS